MSPREPSDNTLATKDKAEDVTFAVELKFLLRQDLKEITSMYGSVRNFVPHRPKDVRHSMTKSETRVWQDNWEAVAKAIDAIPGVNATSQHQSQAQRTEFWKTHWMVYKSNSSCPSYMTYYQDNPDLPIFDADAPDYRKYIWTPVEVCSPILSWPQKTKALGSLTAILEKLNKEFDVVANASTEVHVHIGRADGKFYSLKTMKKLATLFWLSEPLLRALKDPESPNYDHHYTWSFAMRENSRVGLAIDRELPNGQTVDDLYTGRPHEFDAFLGKLMDARASWSHEGYACLKQHRQALRAIWRAVDHNELSHMLRGPERKLRRLGFNLHAIEMDVLGEATPRTIEFRFLEGFIDSNVVPGWVRLCGELIDVVVDQDDEGKENWEFYEVVAALLTIPQDWPIDAQFSAFLYELGRVRIPRLVSEPLQAVVRKNHPPSRRSERD
ncbi:unnamed protein product [Discula destructiva]